MHANYENHFSKVYSVASEYTTVGLVVSLLAAYSWPSMSFDIKTDFLNDLLDFDLYAKQPSDYVQAGKMSQVCLLTKAVYGLMYMARLWYQMFDKL